MMPSLFTCCSQGSTEDPQPDLPPLTAALLSPLWRDRLACRLLLDRMEAALAPSAEADHSAAADGSARTPSAEETSAAADATATEAAEAEQVRTEWQLFILL